MSLDGKSFADTTLVIALGEIDTRVRSERAEMKVLTPFLRSLIERGLDLAVVPAGGNRRWPPSPGQPP